MLLHSLESPAASLRFATMQGFLVLTDILSAGDHGTAQTAQLVRRLWVAKFDVDEENAKVGEKYAKNKLTRKADLFKRNYPIDCF